VPASSVLIETVTDVTPELQAAVTRLIPQLTVRKPPGESELLALVKSDSSSLLVARDGDGSIVGMACVVIYHAPTGIRSIIEDVVVDGEARGQGVGEALTRACLNLARTKGAPAVTLTSNPAREAANRLYLRMGFTRRDTNSYIYRFS
jgi:ribosomal protein S18 acetylase RimI-like enzyme